MAAPASRSPTRALSSFHLYVQEAVWKSIYVLASAVLCLCVCVHFFDVFLFHHAHVFLTATHTDTFMTLDVTEAFSTMFVLCTYVTCVCVFPLCVYSCLTFMTPSCFRVETHVFLGLSVCSAVLFVCSYHLALHVICPCVWHFFLAQEHMHTWHYAPRLAPYVSVLVSLLCLVHIVCQLPCLACLCYFFWHVPMPFLVQQRKTMHVGLLLISACVCPPDVGTQTLCWCCLVGVLESVLFFLCVTHAYSLSIAHTRP
jgi:Sec-independent protein secretion pathway component TatC